MGKSYFVIQNDVHISPIKRIVNGQEYGHNYKQQGLALLLCNYKKLGNILFYRWGGGGSDLYFLSEIHLPVDVKHIELTPSN